ncbi:nucleotidyltransferase substrate binding protein [Pseudanabaena sp. FACHB-1277]|uniref:Nucleotidyltransferase substrate binding protein n=1 Tax=Pseudanabaena cinerea FACHB-1277 TaxID=2949581 RepID=A0A926UQ46_9CYAN|nr:nucleotidyltransferase substrate binding protein [Pseudanabaena cinerea]MBD2149186.1 nucleotidyltransferase substrate binding protein [Pseudanabaena cinerea FACHB-1277]
MQNDIRWKQRFYNYQKAIVQLTKFIEKGELNELEEQGIIKAFEYTYELAWNVIKDYYEEQGEVSIQGSRDALRLAFQRGLITDGDNWMKMIKSRIASVHTYNLEVAQQINQDIHDIYFQLFIELKEKMETL